MENRLSPGYIKGDVNHPYTTWLAAAKVLSKTEAEENKEKFEKWCKDFLNNGDLYVIKENRAKRAGWRG
jgi:hypothetical protein